MWWHTNIQSPPYVGTQKHTHSECKKHSHYKVLSHMNRIVEKRFVHNFPLSGIYFSFGSLSQSDKSDQSTEMYSSKHEITCLNKFSG